MADLVVWFGIILVLVVIAIILYAAITVYFSSLFLPIGVANPLLPIGPPVTPPVQLYNIQSVATSNYLTVASEAGDVNYVSCDGFVTDPTSTWIISPTSSSSVILVNVSIGGSLFWRETSSGSGSQVHVGTNLNPAQSLVQVQTGTKNVVIFQDAQNTSNQLETTVVDIEGSILYMTPVDSGTNNGNMFVLFPISAS